ncbi:MAG: RAMP superfamily CRISPR-associated protein, partial [Clostridiales bacterium]|nr:RAMP superfamily CRISPR-associated protein [Clostridiales bacterium]
MKATFTYAVCYQVQAQCRTPLRTGGADSNMELVLIGSNGQPLVQGSSLAGALRAWVQQAHGTAAAEALFGSQKRTGHLIVSEGKFSKDPAQSVRPRLRIDPKTGSAAERQKFDLAQLNTGARFDFTLTWLGQGENKAELRTLEEALSALHGGVIRLGAQKSNGFGRVSLAVKKRTYDMTQEQDRTAWLAEPRPEQERDRKEQRKWKNLSPLPPVVDARRVTFTVTGQADSILVKSAAAKYKDSEKESYIPNLTENGTPILPGSSVKGAVRAQAERIAQCTGRAELAEALFGRESRDEDNGQAGKVRFDDAKLDKAQSKQISRIRINRFTGGVIHQGLFVEEPLCSPVTLTVAAQSDCKAGCALLLYALRDLGLGLYNLGSGGSIGRGYLRVEQIEARRGNSRAKLTFPENEGCVVSDPDGLVAE